MKKSMLPYPLMDWDAKEALKHALVQSLECKEVTLSQAWALLLAGALAEMAQRQMGSSVSAEFARGARLWARQQVEAALWRIEQECLLPLCDLDARTDAIYEELEAFGRRAPEHFDDERQAFRF